MNRYDCHCHIFNITTVGWKAITEQLNDAINLLKEQSQAKSNVKSNTFTKSDKRLKDKIAKLAELIRIFTQDSEKILDMLDKHYNREYILFPLMFDGDYLLDSYDEENIIQLKSLIDNAGKKLRGKSQIDTPEISIGQRLALIGTEDSKTVLNFLKKLSTQGSIDKFNIKKDGFNIQLEQIEKIVANPKYAGRIYPFLGVDPRRKGILDLVKAKVGAGKVFAGIKVYPPNGFSPMHKLLVGKDSIFEYCSKNNIPVISHCSFGGFATPAMEIDLNGMIIPDGKSNPVEWNKKYSFKTGLKSGFGKMVQERAAVLNHPKIWNEVLKRYPNLILVLAHFGSGSDEWQDKIKEMMKTYSGLYTDVSCMSDKRTLLRVKLIAQSNPEIGNKFLYGSDYFLDMFFNDSFDQYISRMKRNLGSKIFNQITTTNPQNFHNSFHRQNQNINK